MSAARKAMIAVPLWFIPVAVLAAEVAIVVNGRDGGREYEGIGGVSAGASSELLIDYPEPYRSDILDFLFKPRFGAGLQHFKGEIGGGENSTCGSEASHAITPDELANPKPRGYELWMMQEARKRNPRIILDCLPWTFPYWAVDSRGRPFTEQSAEWFVAFLRLAKEHYGIELDWVAAAKNESGLPDPEWVRLLRRKLDAAGFSRVRLQTPEHHTQHWKIFDLFERDPEFAKLIDAVGYHYVNGWINRELNLDTPMPSRRVPPKAKASGKRLWGSEEWSLSGQSWRNAMVIVRSFNKLYCVDRITKYEVWAPIDSIYNYLDFSSVGAVHADTPWSGHYEVWPAVWALAHYSQFVEPGWRYLDGACRKLTPETWHGSVVALRDPESDHWSMIVATAKPLTLEVTITNGLRADVIHVWRSSAKEQFVREADITPKNGTFKLDLAGDSLYSLTTTTGQRKGRPPHPIPPDSPFPFPYREDFEKYRAGEAPRYFADQKGTFEVVEVAGNKCLAQIVPKQGNIWMGRNWEKPWTVLGEFTQPEYSVSADVRIVGGSVEVGGGYSWRAPAFRLLLDAQGNWKLIQNIRGGGRRRRVSPNTLASGTVAGFQPARWHNLRLTRRRPSGALEAWIDGKKVASAKVAPDTSKKGEPAFLASTYHRNLFDNVAITRPD